MIVGRKIALPKQVSAIYRSVEELQNDYPGRKFTPDGHLVGSLGEVIAAREFNLELLPASAKAHDAIDENGRFVQIKLTGGKSISLRHDCDRLLVMRILNSDYAEVVYYGEGEPIWNAAGKMQTNGQRSISIYRINQVIDGTYK